MCGDVLKLWARGRWALLLCLGAGAPDPRWQVWRCPTCGFIAIQPNACGPLCGMKLKAPNAAGTLGGFVQQR